MLRILIIAAAMPAFFRRSRRNRDLLIHHRAPPEVGHSQNMSYLQDLIQQTGSDVSMNTQIRTGQIQENTTGMASTTTTTTINTDSVADAVHDGEYAMSWMGQKLPRHLLISVSAKGHLLRGLDAASFDRIPAQSHDFKRRRLSCTQKSRERGSRLSEHLYGSRNATLLIAVAGLAAAVTVAAAQVFQTQGQPAPPPGPTTQMYSTTAGPPAYRPTSSEPPEWLAPIGSGRTLPAHPKIRSARRTNN
jgi:hypothetical protein